MHAHTFMATQALLDANYAGGLFDGRALEYAEMNALFS